MLCPMACATACILQTLTPPPTAASCCCPLPQIVPGQAVVPPCMIPESVTYEGVTLPTPCFLQGLWP